MPTIKPITELRNTNEISEICHTSGEPIFITKNGYGDLVVMSVETYEKQQARIDLYEKLSIAEEQLNSGEPLVDGEEMFRKLVGKYGHE